MSAKLIFPLSNNYSQDGGRSQGICTAASMAWAKACLRRNAGVNSYAEIGVNQIGLEAQMAVIRKLDHAPSEQTSKAGLKLVTQINIASIDSLIQKAKAISPHVAIFWNSFHTMGYRYAHNEKEFFDMNEGLFRAKTSAEIKSKIEEVFRRKSYGSVLGMRLVSL